MFYLEKVTLVHASKWGTMQRWIHPTRKMVGSSSKESVWRLQRTQGNRWYVFSWSGRGLTSFTQWKCHSSPGLRFQFCQRRLFYYLIITYYFSIVRWFKYYPVKKRPPPPCRETEVRRTIYNRGTQGSEDITNNKLKTMTTEVNVHWARTSCSRYLWCAVHFTCYHLI